MSQKAADVAVRISAARKNYGSLAALNGLDLDIEQGEFFGLLGPNGAGKSTLINSMAGLTRLDSGSISIQGADTVTDYREARRQIGVVPQELVYDPFFTARESMKLQAGFFGLGNEVDPWIDRLLAGLGLEDKANTAMRGLSGGMKRRVLIGQALVHRPPVVVLDEPTAGVDVELRHSLWRFIKELHAEGHTIVLTTHYLEEAESLCDRIAIMNKGELVALDTRDGLLSRHQFRCLELTLGEELAAAKLPASLADTIQSHNGNKLVLKLEQGKQTVGDVLTALHGVATVVDVKTTDADLEDVFLQTVEKHNA
jgi:ABC-2 type transport system ATP-binding protein